MDRMLTPYTPTEPARTLPLQLRYAVAERSSPQRPQLERRVQQGFGEHFGACISGFMPHLAHFDNDAVIGYRGANEESLYLEHYLDAPIEDVIAKLVGTSVRREQIVEVGQLVVDSREAIGPLFRSLAPFLKGLGFNYICFTATAKIRLLLERAGLRGVTVARASEEAVYHAGDAWGSYYDNDPHIIVGRLDDPRGRWIKQAELGV